MKHFLTHSMKVLGFFAMALLPNVVMASAFGERLIEYTSSCWFCGIFRSIFETLNNMISISAETTRGVFLVLLSLGLLFWLLFRVGRVMIDITPDSGDKTFVSDIFKQILRVMVASLLIFNYLSIFDYILSPAMELSIGVGKKIVSREMDVVLNTASQEMNYAKTGSGEISSQRSISEKRLCQPYINLAAQREAGADRNNSIGENRMYDKNNSAYSNLVKEAFVCFIYTGEAAMSVGMATGATMIHGGFQHPFKADGWLLVFMGLIIYCAFFFIFLSMPLKLFDPLLQLALVSALLPLWCALWAFEKTADKTKTALGLFINVMVTFVVLSIVAVICINIMNSALPENRVEFYKKLLADDDVLAAAKATKMELAGKSIILTLVLGVVAFSLLGQVKSLADKFSGESGMDMGLGKMATGGLTAAAGLTAVGARAAGHGVSAGASKAYSNATTLGPEMTQGKGLGEWTRSSLLGRAFSDSWDRGKDADGNTLRADKKTGVMTSKNTDGTIDRYSATTGEMVHMDKKGEFKGSYNTRTQELNLGGGRKYTINGRSFKQGDRSFDLGTDQYTVNIGNKQYEHTIGGGVVERTLDNSTGRYVATREYTRDASGAMVAHDWNAATGRFDIASAAPVPSSINSIMQDAATFKRGALDAERLARPFITKATDMESRYSGFVATGSL
ncbi:MAG: hypothetical protein II942_03715 [Alphaproteobacteria bacterium]|nr:hypothetical protein [Alphaproteobacteria bacterium]